MSKERLVPDKNMSAGIYPGSAEAIFRLLDPFYEDNESIIKEALELAESAGLTEAITDKGESARRFNELRAIVGEVYGRRNPDNNA